MMGHTGPLGWKLASPLAFGDSRSHPALQLADVVASTTVAILSRSFPAELASIMSSIDRHRMIDCILPELERVDPVKKQPMVSSLILYDLAQRAARQSDPYDGLAQMYALAETAFDQGKFGPKR